MADRQRIGLDNAAFYGRLRQGSTPPFQRQIQASTRLRPNDAAYSNNSVRPRLAPANSNLPLKTTINSADLVTPTINNNLLQKTRRVQPLMSNSIVAPLSKTHISKTPALIKPMIMSVTEPLVRHVHPELINPEPAPSAKPKATTIAHPVITVQTPQPFAAPAQTKQQRSKVLRRQSREQQRNNTKTAELPTQIEEPNSKPRRSKTQISLLTMAAVVFAVGVFASLQTVLTNRTASTQVAALSKKAYDQSAAGGATTSDAAVPSTIKPPAKAVAAYAVAPNLPRYLNIPKLGIHTRVLSLGILSSGALATPNNVYDAGWYNESSLPGQPGAMLLDGHDGVGNLHGVFYGLKTLQIGDTMQIQRGDGTNFTYKVVKMQRYPESGVDMNAALNSITPGKPGLNLITCDGKLETGGSDLNYDHRLIVYTEQI